MISMIVAAATNNAIGKDNKLLWHQPTDMKFFKNTTWGSPVIMGRKSYEGIGHPLAGRQNIVITSNPQFDAGGAVVVQNITDGIEAAKANNCNEIFIIGGGQIYKAGMPLADKIYLTRVHTIIDGDSFFPEIDTTEWTLASTTEIKADEKNKFDMSFETWVRNK